MKAVPCTLALAAVCAALPPVCGFTDLHIHKKARPGIIRVACIGDSITYGAQIPNCFANSYPAKLGRLLGKDYHVENFGLNNRNVQTSGPKPYSAEKEYRRSIDFKPEIIVLMLGTNDTKPVAWKSPEHFVAEYRALLNSYLALDGQPRVILCTPPWAKEPAALLPHKPINSIIVDRLCEIADLVTAIGREYDLPVIDLYNLFAGREDLLNFDRLHPNTKGAALIAETICAQLTGDEDTKSESGHTGAISGACENKIHVSGVPDLPID